MEYVFADVSTLKGMKELADSIKQRTDTLDALVLSTGVVLPIISLLRMDWKRVLFAREFARRNPDNEVVMNILHVGIAKTGIMRETNFFLRLLADIFGKSPEALACNTVFLASDESINFSGYFLKKPGKPSVREKLAHNAATAERLWNKSMELIKPVL